jgi:hypothetical protein
MSIPKTWSQWKWDKIRKTEVLPGNIREASSQTAWAESMVIPASMKTRLVAPAMNATLTPSPGGG